MDLSTSYLGLAPYDDARLVLVPTAPCPVFTVRYPEHDFVLPS